MKRLAFLSFAGLFAAAWLGACAENDGTDTHDATDAQTLPSGDGGTTDAATDGSCGDKPCAPADCTAVDFCAVPFPVSRLVALNAVWGSGPNDVWAVGTRGMILHGDGTTFSPVAVDAGTGDVWVSVWGTGSGDVWILGPSFPMHSTGAAGSFDARQGSSWNAQNSGTGRLWAGASAGDRVWLGGETSRRFGTPSSVWNYVGDAWTAAGACTTSAPCSPTIRSIWAADANTAWAVGDDGGAYTFDAAGGADARFVPQNSQTRSDLDAVWGTSASDVWAVGHGGVIRHTAKGESVWTMADSTTTHDLHGIWGSGPSDVWAVGDDGTVVHFDGTEWKTSTIGLPDGDTPTHLLGVWGSGPDDVWIVGEGVLLHRTATSRRGS